MDSLSSEFEAAWAAFQTLDSLRLIEDTLESEWTRGRSDYLAFLVPIEDAGVRAHAARLVDRLSAIPGVQPYPEPYWHMTVKGLGFQVPHAAASDEISAPDAQRIADSARPVFSTTDGFDAQIGLASAFPKVVFLEVWNGLPIRQLNCRLLERIPGLVRYPFDGAVFLPHVSIARFTSSEGLAQLKRTITALRDEPPGPAFPVRKIDLIRARLSAGAPTFELLERYPLR